MEKMKRIEQLKSFLKEDEEDSFIRFALAQEYTKHGILKSALDEYLEIYRRNPHYVGLYYHLGKLYEELSEQEDAMKIYEEGIALTKEIADFHALSELMNAKTNLEMEL